MWLLKILNYICGLCYISVGQCYSEWFYQISRTAQTSPCLSQPDVACLRITERAIRDLQVYLTFPKFVLCFDEQSITVLTTQKKSKGFWFLPKKKKAESENNIDSVLVLQRAVTEAAHPKQREWHPQLLPQKLHSASQLQATRALDCVCEHLCLIMTSFWYPLSKCVQWYQKRPREVIFGGSGNAQNFFPFKLMVFA